MAKNKIDSRVIKVAKLVRDKVTRWTKDNRDVDDNLCGACAIASYTLWRVLNTLGYSPTFACIYTPDCSHCWIEIGDKMLDITATQFGESEIFVASPDHWINYFLNDDSFDDDYIVDDTIEVLKNKQAISTVKDWSSQSPVSYYKEINRLCRQVVKDFVQNP